jgi:hypothetical protein
MNWFKRSRRIRTPRLRSGSLVSLPLVLLVITCTCLSAQYSPGDLVVASAYFSKGNPPSVFRIAPNGKVQSIRSPNFLHVTRMVCSPDNRSIWVSAYGQTEWGIYDLAQDGTVTTLTSRLMNLIGIDGQGRGICEEAHVGVFRITGTGVLSTILKSTSFGGTGWGIDLQSNSIVLDQSNAITRLSLHGAPVVTTIWKTRWSRFDAPFCYDPLSDLFLGTSYQTLTAMRVRGGFAFASVASAPWSYRFAGLMADPVRRKAVLHLGGGWSSKGLYPRLELFDLDGATNLGTILLGSSSFGLMPEATVIAGSRNFGGVGPAIPGGVFSALVSFPSQPGAQYVAAFSFGMRPFLRSPDGRPILVRPDALFWLSVANSGGFSGCQGVLDAKGEAYARIAIPRDPKLSGLRVFGAAVTILRGRINSISAPFGVTIQ